MPILPPSLDDRSFGDLVDELVARIPAHTPEWSNANPGDPGRTLIELFAWLADTMLYRVNLIPERQRLAFLRLLGNPMRPAAAAAGVVAVTIDDDRNADAVMLASRTRVKGNGPASFETTNELTVLPVAAEGYFKRPLSDAEATDLAPVVDGLREVYKLSHNVRPYVTTPVFVGGAAEPAGFDLVARTIDRTLWFALLAPTPDIRDAVRATLGGRTPAGAPHVLSVGIAPQLDVPALSEQVGPRSRIPHVWEMCGVDTRGEPRWFKLDILADDDTTQGLTRRGVIRLVMPTIGTDDLVPGAVRRILAPSNDVRNAIDAGVADRPPRLDDPKKAARLVTWLRMRPDGVSTELTLSWAGINAVEIDARRTITGNLLGQSDGSANQVFSLPGTPVESDTLAVQVEETNRGYVPWQRIDDLALAGRDDAVFALDPEAGTITFGDAVRGRIPEQGRRVRVASCRVGGGRDGNVAVGALTRLENPLDIEGQTVSAKLKVAQPLATDGGDDAESLADAERRIPALFRDRDRAVTTADYKRLTADTQGVRMGRVEVLPGFKPQQRRSGVPGVVTVMALPFKDGTTAPAPRPDRPFLETVFANLDPRRPLTTELYVVGCEYVPMGVGVAVTIRDGFGRDATLQAVQEALRVFLWALQPGGVDGGGWQLGRSVTDREIEVAVARVPGVLQVNHVSLFTRDASGAWRPVAASGANPATIAMLAWQLPELLAVIAIDSDAAVTSLDGLSNPFQPDAVAVPVVPELC
jgi:predicted phage baseplate assembly protein